MVLNSPNVDQKVNQLGPAPTRSPGLIFYIYYSRYCIRSDGYSFGLARDGIIMFVETCVNHYLYISRLENVGYECLHDTKYINSCQLGGSYLVSLNMMSTQHIHVHFSDSVWL